MPDRPLPGGMTPSGISCGPSDESRRRRRRNPGARSGAVERPPHPSAVAVAEASLLRALSIAQDQGSRAWELRAVTSLARLWKGGIKSHDGRTLLTSVLGCFTEGADTADVRNARTLLAELG